MNRIFESGAEPLTVGQIAEAFELRYDSCSEESNGYVCNRRRGHQGAHIAVMDHAQIAQIWYDPLDEMLYETLRKDNLTEQ